MSLSIAWIIGANGGIASAAIKAAAMHYDELLLVDKKPIDEGALGSQMKCAQLDCSDPKSLQTLKELSGPPDTLIVCAGEVLDKSFQETSVEEVESLVRNNLLLTMLSIQEFLKFQTDRERSIVIVSSNAAFSARPSQPLYACLKASITSLVKSLAIDLGPKNVRINAVAPGTVWVDRNNQAICEKFKSPPEDPARPSGRIALPGDLVETFSYLLKSSQVTGQTIVVDGGSSL